MREDVATQLVHTLAQACVRRIFGLAGDSLNGITEALRQQTDIACIHVRHEGVAAFATSGAAQRTGNLAVCAGSCGPGNLHLVNGLCDAHRRRRPALLDVVTAKQGLSKPPTIGLEQVKAFSLWVLRAVTSGRGGEVIDLAATNLRRR